MNISGRYDQMVTDREPFLQRARENALLTIPSLMPPEGHTGASKLVDPYQSVGARGVTSIASKAVQTLLPPNEPFFRLDIDEHTLAELSKNEDARTKVEEALTSVERTVSRNIESSGTRAAFLETTLQLVNAGNALIYIMDDMNAKVFHLDRYVVARDPAGNWVELIAKETVAKATLPESVTALLGEDKIDPQTAQAKAPLKSDTVDLYTQIRREGKRFVITQFANDIEIESSRGSYPLGKCPWIPLRWTRISGEDYGRSYVDGISGDLKTLEAISKAITEYTAAASKVIPLVNPNGVTDEEDLAEAENFEFVSGVAEDVSFVSIDKYADLQVAKNYADDLTRRIEQYFLMHTSVQRGGERVTAEEIRYMAAELEANVGAVYVQLSMEYQLPLVQIAIDKLTKQKKIPALPKDTVKPTVTTGIDALSRQSDLNKLDTLVAGLRDLFGPEALTSEMNVADYVKRRASALGVDPKGLLYTEDQKAQQAEAAQQRQMSEQAMGPMMGAMSGALQEGMKNG